MIDYAQALATVLESAPRLEAQSLPVEAALGRVLAAPELSPAALPPFDNSAMDGFALATGGDTLPAGDEADIVGERAAGDIDMARGDRGFSIMTGARVPDGLDAVIPVEQAEVLAHDASGRATRIRLKAPLAPGQNLRYAGSDIDADAIALSAGRRFDANQLMLAAALGIGQVQVVRRPRVALICTGKELVDEASQALQSGQIRNSNGPYLAARLALAGAEVVHRETVSDDSGAFEAALRRTLDAGVDAVLSTGAVSMGRYDFIPDSLQRLGAHTLFHKVAMRPGKPLLFAQLAEGPLFFGLPGNPISGAVGLRFFVEPALRRMLGQADERPLRLPLGGEARKKAGLRMFYKAALETDADGRPQVRVLAGQESFRIRPLAAATCWAVGPEAAEQLPAGTLLDVYGPGHHQAAQLGDTLS
ncbi:gephyrin-like molybdotransferase Glp [Oleiagrimonas sp. C23AA]|uniref:molybdopterin molybdotransferase MoeA n=1 Tax=Oleiagrimonas sp. C23AA TaxID=2719047 RepID=UPI001423A72B|nr:gephyrin-like molybdotransferase Glp [Oleiagrimonas sp. C23AA]NII11237.1 molybdopterin molybdotransferase MoeA [Oleiagrimonas sp. C23AA]